MGIKTSGDSLRIGQRAKTLAASTALMLMSAAAANAQDAGQSAGGEANLKLPDLSQVTFLGGTDGHTLLLWGILFCIFGLAFGLTIYVRLKNLPVHRSMREISELIYETCKTYLTTQGKFLLLLWVLDRKSTRLNSSHQIISYAAFCLKTRLMTCNTLT